MARNSMTPAVQCLQLILRTLHLLPCFLISYTQRKKGTYSYSSIDFACSTPHPTPHPHPQTQQHGPTLLSFFPRFEIYVSVSIPVPLAALIFGGKLRWTGVVSRSDGELTRQPTTALIPATLIQREGARLFPPW